MILGASSAAAVILRNPVAVLKWGFIALLAGYSAHAYLCIGSLENDLVTERAEKAILKANNSSLSAAVDSQNQRVTELANEAEARAEAARDALTAAAGQVGDLQSEIDRIRATQGNSCEDADLLINRAFGL